jgi:hypothetical protein
MTQVSKGRTSGSQSVFPPFLVHVDPARTVIDSDAIDANKLSIRDIAVVRNITHCLFRGFRDFQATPPSRYGSVRESKAVAPLDRKS